MPDGYGLLLPWQKLPAEHGMQDVAFWAPVVLPKRAGGQGST